MNKASSRLYILYEVIRVNLEMNACTYIEKQRKHGLQESKFMMMLFLEKEGCGLGVELGHCSLGMTWFSKENLK